MIETFATAESIPHTLASRGLFEVRSDADEVLFTNDDVVSATVVLGLRAQPRAVIQLTESATDVLAHHMVENTAGHLTYWVDGVLERQRDNMPPEQYGQLEVEKWDIPPAQSVAYAAHLSVIIDEGPLPCDAEVDVRAIEAVAP